jgi:methyl-accepting chemotaxis protein
MTMTEMNEALDMVDDMAADALSDTDDVGEDNIETEIEPTEDEVVLGKVDEIVGVCARICQGDFEARILDVPQQPGRARELCLRVNEMIDRIDAYVRESTACLHFVAQNRYFRRVVEDGMLGNFLVAARSINSAADGVAEKMDMFGALVGEMNDMSNKFTEKAEFLGEIAGTTREVSTSVAAGAAEALANVQTVAAASEELSSSIQEINRQVAQNKGLALEAVAESEKAKDIVGGLSGATESIGGVIGLINEIAAQTNLLALNATIEAARAGDAGRGFAVVANEVKALALQTAKATDEVGKKISEIRGATDLAVESISGIGGKIDKFSEVSMVIATAVEEQGAATAEIARNIEEASNGVADIAEGISSVSQNADQVNESSGDVLSISGDLAAQANRLQDSLRRKD